MICRVEQGPKCGLSLAGVDHPNGFADWIFCQKSSFLLRENPIWKKLSHWLSGLTKCWPELQRHLEHMHKLRGIRIAQSNKSWRDDAESFTFTGKPNQHQHCLCFPPLPKFHISQEIWHHRAFKTAPGRCRDIFHIWDADCWISFTFINIFFAHQIFSQILQGSTCGRWPGRL